MFKFITSLVFLGTFCTVGFAAEETAPFKISTTQQPSPPAEMATKGIRIGVFKPTYKVRGKITDVKSGFVVTGETRFKGDLDSDIGVSVGYVQMPIRQLGFAGTFSVIDIDSGDFQLYRFEGNAGYALNRYVYGYGGLNVNKFLGDKDINDLDAGFGVQLGTGIQISKSVGLDIRYVLMRQEEKVKISGVEAATVEIIENGLEAGITATF